MKIAKNYTPKGYIAVQGTIPENLKLKLMVKAAEKGISMRKYIGDLIETAINEKTKRRKK